MNGVKTVTIDEINDAEVILNDYFNVIGYPFYYKINKVYNDGSISYYAKEDDNDKLLTYTAAMFEIVRNSNYESITYDPEKNVYKCATIRDWNTLTNAEKALIIHDETEKLHS